MGDDGVTWEPCTAPECRDREHVPQDCASVYKHQHLDDQPCTRPWTALCQTRHGDLCHNSNHTSQPDAMAALCAHLAAGRHIPPGAGDRRTETPCKATS